MKEIDSSKLTTENNRDDNKFAIKSTKLGNDDFEFAWELESKNYEQALKEIAKTCPLLNKNKDEMYGENADSLFAQSTARRMEIAKEVLK